MKRLVLLLIPLFLLISGCATLDRRDQNRQDQTRISEKQALLDKIEEENRDLIETQKKLDQRLAKQNLSLNQLNYEISNLIQRKKDIVRLIKLKDWEKEKAAVEIKKQEDQIKKLEAEQEKIKQLSEQNSLPTSEKLKRIEFLNNQMRELNADLLDPESGE